MYINYVIKIESQKYWYEQHEGVIFVKFAQLIPIVYNWLLLENDNWKNYSDIVQLMPYISNVNDIKRCCNNTGKTSINIDKFIKEMEEKGIDIFIYQYQKYE